MDRTERVASAERVMLRAASHVLGETIRDEVCAVFDARGADIWLIDYRMAELLPLLADRPGHGMDSDAGRAFTGQETVSSGQRTYVPLTVQGDRIGVLEIEGASSLDGLAEFTAAAAMAVLAADRFTDRFRVARRSDRLTLAAEIQWQLLPGRGLRLPEADLAAQLEPAYSVRGDAFDWTAGPDAVELSVLNGMGEGVLAALATSLGVGALRNARRAGLPIADQAVLADQAVYAQYGGRTHLSTLLLRVDLATGRVAAVDAGSPKVFRLRGGAVEQVELDAELPLGMFEGTDYTEQEFALAPGDRLAVVSDGIWDASAGDSRYGEDQRLERLLASTGDRPAAEAVRLVLDDLSAFHAEAGNSRQEDDAVCVVLDWRGRA